MFSTPSASDVSAPGAAWQMVRMATLPAPRALTEEALTEIALAHLARYGTTRAGLARVLRRRIDRWAARTQDEAGAAAARAAVPALVERLAASGAVDDAAFAAARSRRLAESGRSRRAVAAHLLARGVSGETLETALPQDDLAAAAVLLRRRRFGPFRDGPADADIRRRELGALARAGFPQAVARAALALDRDAAETLILRLRRP